MGSNINSWQHPPFPRPQPWNGCATLYTNPTALSLLRSRQTRQAEEWVSPQMSQQQANEGKGELWVLLRVQRALLCNRRKCPPCVGKMITVDLETEICLLCKSNLLEVTGAVISKVGTRVTFRKWLDDSEGPLTTVILPFVPFFELGLSVLSLNFL